MSTQIEWVVIKWRYLKGQEGKRWMFPVTTRHKWQSMGVTEWMIKLRHLAENCFLSLKRWRGIATRYARTSDAFIAVGHVRCIAISVAICA